MATDSRQTISMKMERIKQQSPMVRLVYWIKERQSILLRKSAKTPKPWTDDEILRSYRFCNVRREDDKVTKWIADNWRTPHETDPHTWFAMVVARLINWPDTLEEIGYPINHGTWDPSTFVYRMNRRQKRKEKLFTGAYMIHADATHGGTKAEYLAECVLAPMWDQRGAIGATFNENSLRAFFNKLREYRDMGEFMAGQVVADVKYLPVLRQAIDWDTFATPGPGSRRGMNRLLGRPTNEKWTVNNWQDELVTLKEHLDKVIKPKLHAQDIQNCLCEWDKFERVLWGQGKPRSKYQGICIAQRY